MHPLSGHVSHRGVCRAGRAGRAAMYLLSDDRVEGADPPGAEASDGQLGLRLRHLPGGLPVEPEGALHRRGGYRERPGLAVPELITLLAMTQEEFSARF